MGGGGGGGGRESDILTGTVGVAADAIGDPARQPAPVCCFMPCYYGIILVFFLVVSLFSCHACRVLHILVLLLLLFSLVLSGFRV